MSCILKPTEDRVAVIPLETKDTTKGGIVLPDQAKEKPQRGEVVAVGPGMYPGEVPGMVNGGPITVWGCRIPVSLKVGDVVLFAKYAGHDFDDGDRTIKILKESDVLAVFGEKDL